MLANPRRTASMRRVSGTVMSVNGLVALRALTQRTAL